MPTIPTGLAINSDIAADRTTASGMRKVLAALLAQSAAGVPVTGILYAPGTPLNVTTSGSAMQYSVSAGFAVTTRTGQGLYLVGTTASVTVPTTAANATNPRIDVIYIVQPDPELAESGVARIDVVQGVPAAIPAVPSIPTGALELGRKTVGAGVTNTTAGSAVSNRPAIVGVNAHWSTIQGLPSTFAPSAHDINGTAHTGVLSVANGGTGATTAANARTLLGITPAAIGAAPSNVQASAIGTTQGVSVQTHLNSILSDVTDLETANNAVRAVSKGGTGSATAAGARQNLGIQTGIVKTSGALNSAGGTLNWAVTFPTAFPVGSTVFVVVSQTEDAHSARDVQVWSQDATRTGFVLNVGLSALNGATRSGIWCNYIAIAVLA